MKKHLASIAVIALVGMFSLTGCQKADEEQSSPPPIESVRAFEDGSGAGEQNARQTDQAGSGYVSKDNGSKEKLSPEQVTMITASVKEAGDWLSLSYQKGNYPDTLGYQSGDNVDITLVKPLSSKDSFCLQGISNENRQESETVPSSMIIYYDSQTKSVVPLGKSCKAPLGTPFQGDEKK